MAILEVRKDNNRQLQNIANVLANAKKVIVVTGAGISTNCGIPVSFVHALRCRLPLTDYSQDFRSEEGLYSLIQAQRNAASPRKPCTSPSKRRPLAQRSFTTVSPRKRSPEPLVIPNKIKGKDLFDAQLWKDPTSTSVFYTFIASLRRRIQEDVKRTTPAHRFIRTLRDKRKLVRCYTQNIDGLESREELCVDMDRGKGNRSRFTKLSLEKPKSVSRTMPGGDLDGGCEVVQLHGDLESLRCTLCQQTCSWDAGRHDAFLLSGKAPRCESCLTTNQNRQDRGKRGTKIGSLRPNIVLYGEEHPSAESIGAISTHDLASSPDVLLILGTSLHVHGLKVLVKEFARSVHARPGGKGKVIFVNLSKPSDSVWKDMFDYWVAMDCDDWVASLRRHRPDLFQIQNELKLSVRKSIAKPARKVDSGIEEAGLVAEDKENIPNCPVTTPRKQKAQPMVVIASPNKNSPTRNQIFSLQSAKQSQKGSPNNSQLQLATPPSSGHKTSCVTPLSKKRSLAETYRSMCETPSRKRRKASISIWED